MFCRNCGTEIKDDAVFCRVCGTKTEWSSSGASSSVKDAQNRLVNHQEQCPLPLYGQDAYSSTSGTQSSVEQMSSPYGQNAYGGALGTQPSPEQMSPPYGQNTYSGAPGTQPAQGEVFSSYGQTENGQNYGQNAYDAVGNEYRPAGSNQNTYGQVQSQYQPYGTWQSPYQQGAAQQRQNQQSAYGSAPYRQTPYQTPYSGNQYAPAGYSAPAKKQNIVPFVVMGVLFVALAVLLGIFFSQEKESNIPVYTPEGSGVAGTDIADVTFRNNYTEIVGDGRDVYTIMVYIVGSDLESEGGCASDDIREMLKAQLSDNVNVVIQTGGSTYWKNRNIQNNMVQRWTIENGTLVELDNLGKTRMLTSSALADFITFSAEKFPANRYGLILWDHGGGPLYGFGYDEVYPDDVLYLPDISLALKKSRVLFDFVGFDACLMGSVEIAYMIEPYADYLIASEELEPGEGWEYQSWLTWLSKNTSCSTVELGVEIIDSFISDNSITDTLSIVALREIPYVYECIGEFCEEAQNLLADKKYNFISAIRADAKSFSYGEYDMIDIVDLALAAEFESTDKLVAAVNSAVKYRNDCRATGIYGLSMYFPYTDVSVYGYAKEMCSEIGFSGACYTFYDSFVSVMATGQYQVSDNSGILGGDSAESDNPTDYDWYDGDAAGNNEYDENLSNLEAVWSDEEDNYIIPLSDAQWDSITAIEMSLLLDDGEGYIDLGNDQVFYTDNYDNLILNFDNTWVAIDGNVVPYYAEKIIPTDSETVFVGIVYALLNGERDIELILQWTDSAENGYIAGYRDSSETTGPAGPAAKGLMQLKQGDSLEFYCSYYLYDGTYNGEYIMDYTVTVGMYMPEVTYESLGDSTVLMGYRLIDVYQNAFYTEMIELY